MHGGSDSNDQPSTMVLQTVLVMHLCSYRVSPSFFSHFFESVYFVMHMVLQTIPRHASVLIARAPLRPRMLTNSCPIERPRTFVQPHTNACPRTSANVRTPHRFNNAVPASRFTIGTIVADVANSSRCFLNVLFFYSFFYESVYLLRQ